MTLLIAFLRAFLLVVWTLICLPIQLLAWHFSLKIKNRVPHIYHKYCAKMMGVTILQKGNFSQTQPKLILSNHVSWLDIVIISASTPVAFVAKSEVATWPIIGLFAKLQETIFINRTRRSETRAVSEDIKNRILNAQSVVLFAEGTTSDGNRILPFKSALLGALETQDQTIPMQPLAINYHKIAGLPVGRSQKPFIAWYGDMDIASHLWGILKLPSLEVELTWCPYLDEKQLQDRKALVTQAQSQVRIALHKRTS